MNTTTENTSQTIHRQMSGMVVSDKMQKTVTVLINRRVKHKKFGKIISLSSKTHAHNEIDDVRTGDWVTIEETRPISKTKAWKVISLDRKGISAVAAKG